MLFDALTSLKKWQTFKLDALGLVTILGATDLDMALGRLSQSHTCEFLPLLAPFIIANNSVTKEVSGATLYNVTDGIVAFDISGWFVRWLMSQKLGWNSTTLMISSNSKKRTHYLPLISSITIGILIMGPMIAISALQLDWFGFANAIALLMSVVARYIVLSQNRNAIDTSVGRGLDPVASCGRGSKMTKMFCTLPGGKFVTIYCPRGIVIECLLTSPRPPSPKLYKTALAISWTATAVHITTLGMASLIDQIICVTILIAATVTVVKGVGYNEREIGTQLEFHLSDAEDDHRRSAYARLRLLPSEEETLCSWNLFPQRSNSEWWERYRSMPEHARSKGFTASSASSTQTPLGTTSLVESFV